ncbi:MAG: ABC-2 family transporter protein [Kineosporiaceae bacterium]|nr:ABC-2 family transporter protein [Kineosporiaceae bacterium]
MTAYLAFLRAGFHRYATYRLATVAGAFTNSVFGLARAAILASAVAGAGAISAGGYTAHQVITYAWLGQALITPVNVFQWNELALRVRTGDIAIDLARPVDLQLSWLATDLGRAGYSLLPRSLPPVLIGALLFGLALPAHPLPYLLGALSVLLAVVISFACRFAVNLTAFWLVEIRGVIGSYVAISSLLCGLVVPVSWFPGWLDTLATATPFPSLLQAPIDVITGRVSGTAALGTLAVQAFWAVATLGVGRAVLHRATRKLVVQGG